MGKTLLIGLGGYINAVLRFFINGYVPAASRSLSFPFGNLVVRVMERFEIGVLFYCIENRSAVGPDTRAPVLICILGSIASFSTFGLEIFNRISGGELSLAFAKLGENGHSAHLSHRKSAFCGNFG